MRLPNRIIIFCLPGIGDAALFTPALAMLRRALPAAHITAVTMFRGTADILETNPDLNEVRCYDFAHAGKLDGLRYVWSLRREGYDLSIMPFPANRLEYNIVNLIVGRRWRAGHRYQHQSARNLSFLNNIAVTEDGELHNVEENIRLVRAICRQFNLPVPVEKPVLRLPLTDDDRQFGEAFVEKLNLPADAPLFGFHTYSSVFKNMNRKCWDKENFVRLIQRLGETHPASRFLIFSGPADEEVNQYILQHSGNRVILICETNLRRALAILRHCRVFISNDSAIMHLAAGLGVAVVAIFGPTNWQRLHPWSSRHIIVRNNLPCMPCFYFSSRPLSCVANINYACLRDITVDEVFTAVESLLAPAHATTA